MIPLEARRKATEYEKDNPSVSPHEAFIQGYLYATQAQVPMLLDDAMPVQTQDMMSDDELFEHAWQMYDRKDNKKSAIKAWKKLSTEDKGKVLSVIPAYVKAHDEKKYRPMFATFLNQERYNDEDIIINANTKPTSATEQERSFLEGSIRSFYEHNT